MSEHNLPNDNIKSHPEATAAMSKTASAWLESLSPSQKEKATYEYMDGERVFWYYPPLNRHGLALRDMNEKQRELAFDIIKSGLTRKAYEQAVQIIQLETTLGQIEKEAGLITFRREPELYYFTIFGDPSGRENPWGWRVEGHHVSLHYSIWDDKVISATPFFFGSNPAEVLKGPEKGLRILADREDLALELINSMDNAQQSKAVIYDEAPWDILSYNASRPVFPKEEGISGSQMNGTQQEMMMSIINEYIFTLHDEVATERLRIVEAQGLANFHFAWGGGKEHLSKHYYRIHSGNFVIEYDNRQNEANHIHSVYRDVENDFANDVLREHLLLYHVL